MKKCRYMSRKIIVPIFSLLLALSAFFYAPMCVHASETNIVSTPPVSITSPSRIAANITRLWEEIAVCEIVLPSGLTDGENYVFTADVSLNSSFTAAVAPTMNNYAYWCITDSSGEIISTVIDGYGAVISDNCSFVINNYSSTETYSLFFVAYVRTTYSGGSTYYTNLTCNKFDITSYSVSPIEPVESGDYSAGFEAGYAQGQSNGYSSGYSDGFESGYEEGEDAGYNSGFDAGVDSVDTQSFYNQGYEVGYAKGLAESYDSGYNAGYADAMSTIESWGADGTNYPLVKFESVTQDTSFSFSTLSDDAYSFSEDSVVLVYFNDQIFKDYPHDHVYCLRVNSFSPISTSGVMGFSGYEYGYKIGDQYYPVSHVSSDFPQCFYFQGTDIANISIYVRLYGVYGTGSATSFDVVLRNQFDILDCGPSGNTQNHIANQTDELTNGYDDSAGQETSSQFSDGVAEYEEVEGSLFTSAKSGLTDYQFFDLESVPAVVTGISFVTATMTGIFNAMGGSSGAGIVLSVLFSVMLVSIVAGLYRYFVSSGKGGKHDRKGGKG